MDGEEEWHKLGKVSNKTIHPLAGLVTVEVLLSHSEGRDVQKMRPPGFWPSPVW